MTCTRCHGLVVAEYVYGGAGEWWWKCVSCGDRADRRILLNRAEQAAFAEGLRMAQDRDIKEWSRWFRDIGGITDAAMVF